MMTHFMYVQLFKEHFFRLQKNRNANIHKSEAQEIKSTYQQLQIDKKTL